MIPVLKGNAYGHGVELVARALRTDRLPYIAVDGYFEAMAIRDVSRQPVLVMGAIKASNFSKMTYDNFAFVVQDEETVEALAATGKQLKVHLEVNTGMNRYGTEFKNVARLTKAILNAGNLDLEGVMSHWRIRMATIRRPSTRPSRCLIWPSNQSGGPGAIPGWSISPRRPAVRSPVRSMPMPCGSASACTA